MAAESHHTSLFQNQLTPLVLVLPTQKCHSIHDFMCSKSHTTFSKPVKMLRALTCARDSNYITGLTDKVLHNRHHSELIPGLLQNNADTCTACFL